MPAHMYVRRGFSPARALTALVLAATAALLPAPTGAAVTGAIAFEDIAHARGVDFTLRNSATGDKHIVEPMTGGVALFDANGDGRLDIFFANGAALPSLRKDGAQFANAFFRQQPDGRFVNATAAAGLTGAGYAMGAAVADYDNDGHPDLFVPGLNESHLFHNRGDGTFEDVTARAGLDVAGIQQRWSVAGGWFDYDNDGLLDLFIVRYLVWDPARERVCPNASAGYRIYCDPKYYQGTPNALLRNNGNGTFTDVSEATGIAAAIGKGMSVAFSDYDQDGRLDVFVANDTVPNFLFHSDGGRFTEVGLAAGVSVNNSGQPVSSMGIDVRDYDNDGRDDMIVTALAVQTFPLWRNLGAGQFDDVTQRTKVAAASAGWSGWGVGLFDLDNDGFKDIFAANGDVQDNTEVYSSRRSRQGNAVLRNAHDGTFADVTSTAGPDVAHPAFHRGAAFGDLDGDGRVDVVVSRQNDPAAVFHNVSAEAGHWLRVRTIGRRSNRDGIGTRIHVVSASGHEQWNHVTTAGSYVSASEPVVHFGLGGDRLARTVDVLWPSGAKQRLENVPADQVITVTEPQ